MALRPIDPRPPERWWWWEVGEWRTEGVLLSPSLSPCFVQEGAGGEKDEMDYIWFFNFTFDSSTTNPTVQTLNLKPNFETVLLVHKSPNRLATCVGWTLTCPFLFSLCTFKLANSHSIWRGLEEGEGGMEGEGREGGGREEWTMGVPSIEAERQLPPRFLNKSHAYLLITRLSPAPCYWLYTWLRGYISCQESRVGEGLGKKQRK